MKTPKRLALLLAPFSILFVFILSTDPYKLPLPFLLLPFLLLGLGSYYLFKEVLRVFPLSPRKRIVIAANATALLLLGVLLQSIRQLSIKDLLILLVLIVGATLYMRRLDI